MKDVPLTAEESLRLLRENTDRLVSLIDGEPLERLHAAQAPDEWSANEVLAHMRASCDVWGKYIAKILAEEHPTFVAMNPRAWMRRTDYPGWSFDAGFAAFLAQREELLAMLHSLQPDDWERAATVKAYGQAQERTLRSYASQLAKHEHIHVGQIEQILAPDSTKEGHLG